tara:strand:+ start:1018 stop:1158 length:141 start_codon:yes stop_codon:yes gene_type:complete
MLEGWREKLPLSPPHMEGKEGKGGNGRNGRGLDLLTCTSCLPLISL